MTRVNVTKAIQAPASEAWSVLSSFRNIEDISPIARSVVEGDGAGAKRICYMPDDAAIYETLNAVDNDAMEMEYAITEGPFPVKGYVSTVKVEAQGDGCQISWSAEFEVSDEARDEMVSLFEGFYNVIIDSLETMINSKN